MSYWSSFRKHIHLTEKILSISKLEGKLPIHEHGAALPCASLVVTFTSLREVTRIEFHGGRTPRRRGAAAPTFFRRGGERAAFGPAQLLRARDRARSPLRRSYLPRVHHLRDAGIPDQPGLHQPSVLQIRPRHRRRGRALPGVLLRSCLSPAPR